MKKTEISVDSESGPNGDFIMMPVAFEFTNGKKVLFIIYNEKYPILKSMLDDYKSNDYKIIKMFPYQDNVNFMALMFEQLIKLGIEMSKRVSLNFFCSFRDIAYLFGFNNIKGLIVAKAPKNYHTPFIVQNSTIRGLVDLHIKNQIFYIKLHDCYGYSTGKSKTLSTLLETLNLEKTKKSCNSEKSKMEILVTNTTKCKELITYSINDVNSLFRIRSSYIENFNSIIKTIKINERYNFTNKNTPKSFGSTVSQLLRKLVANHFEDEIEIFDNINLNISINKEEEISNLLTGASIQTIFETYPTSTGLYNAIIQGGRNINESPENFVAENVIDADFQGCYGSALETLDLPIGLPTVYAESLESAKEVSLGDFLKMYENELVNNLYTITVTGRLSFKQDLLYSKITTPKKIKEETFDILESNNALSGDFVILKNELINTIFTSDILEALRKICSNKEISEIYKLKVVTAIFYKKSLFIENKTQFLKKMSSTIGNVDYEYSMKNQCVQDKRPRYWTKISLKQIITPLMEERKVLKTKANEFKTKYEASKLERDLEEYQTYESKQQFTKNVVNTIFGGLASKFFKNSNVVLANNITAKARLNVYLMKIVLQGFQSITDGLFYKPTLILEFKKDVKIRKPSLAILSEKKKLLKHQVIRTKNEDYEWESLFTTQTHKLIELVETGELNKYITNKVKEFWNFYNIEFTFNIEHKPEQIARKLFYIKKAHYAYRTLTGEITYKFRGLSAKRNQGNLYFKLANAILIEKKENLQITKESYTYKTARIATCTDYLKSVKMETLQMEPGSEILEKGIFKLTNDDLIVNTLAQHKKRSKIDYAQLFMHEKIETVLKKRQKDHNIKHNASQ